MGHLVVSDHSNPGEISITQGAADPLSIKEAYALLLKVPMSYSVGNTADIFAFNSF